MTDATVPQSGETTTTEEVVATADTTTTPEATPE
jgi:hypothetical protein